MTDWATDCCKSHMTERNSINRYSAFGLEIESELPLPELKPAAVKPNLAIRLGSVARPGNSPLSERCVTASQDEVHLFWEGSGSFLMRGGTEMVVDPAPDAEQAQLRAGILGPGIATILQQRGLLVLHASAIVIGGKAFAFVGWKGQGKSTTAAALFARGCPLLTDDLLALNGKDGQRLLAHPGIPHFKLWPDSVKSSLGEVAGTLPRLMPRYEKRVRKIIDGFAPGPVPLGAIYVLARGPELAVHRLSPQETFQQVVTNTFCARYGNRVFKGQIGEAHLRNVAKVASHVPVFGLERPSSLEGLGAFADFIVQHATNI